MAKYTIVVKKGDILLEVSTQNKAFIEEEFARWVLAAADSEKKRNNPEKKESENSEAAQISPLLKKEFIKPNNPIKNLESKESSPQKDEFRKVLSQKVSEISEQSKEERLEKFKKRQPESQMDAFMKCVYELYEKEKMERFSFSQINVLAEEQFGSSFSYEIIQKAIDFGYIKIVPDYTGMSNVVEYSLDVRGERYLNNVLK